MHHYRKLQQKLDQHPIGAPESEEFIEILKHLFKPEELDLALSLDFQPKPPEKIAEQSGVKEEETKEKLEGMADRGVVLAKAMEGTTYYALLPNYPGLFEYPFMKGFEEDKQKELARLWHAYYMKQMGPELARANPPWNRVFPAEGALEEIEEIEEEEFEILPFEKASEMMNQARSIALASCPCRTTEQQCDRPLEVCLSFDGAAEFLAERGMARLINLEEAQEVLKAAEEAGLVHTGSNHQGRLLFIGNCCPCCCHFLMLITRLGYREGLASSSFEACLDPQECTGCGVCAEERCPTGALTLEEGAAVFSRENCLGCGLCVTTCAGGALTLVKREDYQNPPATVQELAQQVMKNKNRG